MIKDLIAPEIREHLIKSIQYYIDIYPSHLHVLNHILLGYGTGYEWVDGKLVSSYNFNENKKPVVSKKYAKDVFQYGYQAHFCHFDHFSEEYSPLFNIPDNVTEEWLEVIHLFVYAINKWDEREYQMLLLSHYIKTYGYTNPNAYHWYDRGWRDFKKLREYTNQLAKDRGWDYHSVDDLHDPEKKKKHSESMNKMIDEILGKADKVVPEANNQLKKQWIRDSLRNHRNNLEAVKEVVAEMEQESK